MSTPLHVERRDRVLSTMAGAELDVLALGEHWGEGRWNGQSRPGRAPLGIAFTLADLDSPADRVPPQAARSLGEYLGR